MSVAPDKAELNRNRVRGIKAIGASLIPALALNTVGRSGFDEVILGNVYKAVSDGNFELPPSDIAIWLGFMSGSIDLLIGDWVESRVGRILRSERDNSQQSENTLLERGVMMLARFGIDFGLSVAIVNGLAAIKDSI